jgi:hypothetical protein
MRPVGSPTHFPFASMTVPTPLIETLAGVMSPFTSLAMIAYGTLATRARGSISGSSPTLMPRNSVEPLNTFVSSGVSSPRLTEKYPPSKRTSCVSVQTIFPPASAS